MTIREALDQGTAMLNSNGIESANLDASLLLAKVLGISRSTMFSAGNVQITDKSLAIYYEFLKRRTSGECTAYILGKKEFYNLDFSVNPAVLVPRPDTETLVEAALGIVRSAETSDTSTFRILDLCTGSGAVAIALKYEMPELEIWATDISQEALEIAQSNAERLLAKQPDSIIFHLGDIFSALPPSSNEILFDMIVSNPPYIPTKKIAKLPLEIKKEPRIALDGGTDGLEIITEIVEKAPCYLKANGILLIEADPEQMEKIGTLFDKANFNEIKIYKDLSGLDRVISGKNSLKIKNEEKDKKHV